MLRYLPILLLPAALQAQPLDLEPKALDFGLVNTDTETHNEIHLENREDGELEIVVDCRGVGFMALPDTLRLSGKATGTIVVRFSATEEGNYTGELALRVNSFFQDQHFTVPLQAQVAHRKSEKLHLLRISA